jgi:hypothetical protein
LTWDGNQTNSRKFLLAGKIESNLSFGFCINIVKKTVLPIAVAGIWITISEFLRNEFLFKNYWVHHYNSIGLIFETLPVNGILWVIWSFILSYFIFKLLQKFSFIETMFLTWLTAFMMMWITIYNLQVLPPMILIFTTPFSLLEIWVAGIIIKRITE